MRGVIVLIVGLLSVQQVQQGAAPTRAASPSTPAEDAAIVAAIGLHDGGKYDEAIARYADVLKQSPDNVTALFEMAFSHAARKDYAKTLELAWKGTEYQSDLLPMFYDLIGSTLDTMGEPERAVEAYRRGIELVPEASVLYYNLAVTYQESLKNEAQARQALKQAVALAPTEPEPQLLLGQLFRSGGYRTPALLTLGGFLVMQPAGGRSLSAYGLWRAVLRGNADAAPAGGAARAPATTSKADEGDFAALDAFVDASHAAAAREQDGGKSEIQALVGQMDAILTRLAARDAATDRATFVGRHYVPYFVELKQRNYVEPFVYWVSQRAPVPDVREWLDANQSRVREFLAWSGQYVWSKP